MGTVSKLPSLQLYASLLKLYPQSFQSRYSSTMQQTFADMLAAESTGFGRSVVWLRTLIDLPRSALREHVTNGKEMNMNRNLKILMSVFGAAVVLVSVASFWAGSLHVRGTMTVKRVTVSQLADAMQQDDFYSTYGDAAVLFSAQVSAVTMHSDSTLVTFTTGRPYNVVCQFPSSSVYAVGQTISIVAPAGSAEREPRGVLLHDCLQN